MNAIDTINMYVAKCKESLTYHKHLNNAMACQKWGNRLEILESAKLVIKYVAKCKESLTYHKHLNNAMACQKWGNRLEILESAKLVIKNIDKGI